MTMTPLVTEPLMTHEAAKKKATPQQYQFVLQYLALNFNGHGATLAAGYSKKTAKSSAWKLLAKPHIQALVKYEIDERSKRVKYDADKLLSRMVELDELDAADILDDDGNVLPIKQWPKTWRTLISGIEISEIWEGKGDEKEQIGLLKKIKWPCKLKNFELLGKHVNIQAWQMPEINITFTEQLAGRMSSSRKRIMIDGESKRID